MYSVNIWFTVRDIKRCEQIRQKLGHIIDTHEWGCYYAPTITTDLTRHNDYTISIMIVNHNANTLSKLSDSMRLYIWDMLNAMEWINEIIPRLYQDIRRN